MGEQADIPGPDVPGESARAARFGHLSPFSQLCKRVASLARAAPQPEEAAAE